MSKKVTCIAGEADGEWWYTLGKFKGQLVIPDEPSEAKEGYFRWAVRAGAIPRDVLNSSPALTAYHDYCLSEEEWDSAGDAEPDDVFNHLPGPQMSGDITEGFDMMWGGNTSRSAGWLEEAHARFAGMFGSDW